ncbi:MAG: putative porin [Lentisphaeria bacterium]|nr:putative porin [Lentisphaeria bacterium]
MKVSKFISAIAVSVIICSPGNADDLSVQEELKLLREQISVQKAAIRQLELRLDKQQSDQNRLLQGSYHQEKEETPIITLNKHINNLTIKGDLRLRYEKRDVDEKERDRFRTRLRIGMNWKSDDENFEVGVGIATGGSEATSTNDTHSSDSPFESGDLRVDYAYAKHTWDSIDFTIGQMKNPFVTSQFLWDSDVRPVGIVVAYNAPDLKKYKVEGFFLAAGAFDFAYAPDDDLDNESVLAAAQLGLGFEADNLNGIVATSAYIYDNDASKANTFDDNTEPADDIDYKYQIIDAIAKTRMKLSGDVELDLFGHIAMNIGTDSGDASIMNDIYTGEAYGIDEDADDNNIAYALGAKFTLEKLYFGAEYRYVEADAVNSWVSGSDFGSGTATGLNSTTNIEGIVAKVGYKFNNNVSLQLTAMFYDEIENVTNDDNDDGSLYQFDLKYKF